MEIFNEDNYKAIVRNTIEAQPKKGRGQFRKLSEFLGISNVVISQVFSGEKDLTTEQAILTSKFLGFSDHEVDYFLLLVQRDRAGHFKLKNYYQEKILEIRQKVVHLKAHIKNSKTLDDITKQKYYSDWKYSAFRVSCARDDINTTFDIAKYFRLDEVEVRGKCAFLLEHGLLNEVGGKLEIGESTIFIDKSSPMINSHRKNWRIAGFDKMSVEENLFYVSPMCISKNLVDKTKQKLLALIKELHEEIPKEEGEELICFNIDLFKM